MDLGALAFAPRRRGNRTGVNIFADAAEQQPAKEGGLVSATEIPAHTALCIVSDVDILSRMRTGAGLLAGKDAVKLDLVLATKRGKDLGLTGIHACALRAADQKELLDIVDVSDLSDVTQVLKHFTGHARYWALACGGHNKVATYEQLSEWYTGRPYELWYAIQDRPDHSDVPFKVVEMLPPVGMGYLILRYQHLRDALTEQVASQMYIHDMLELMEDPHFHTAFDKDWIVQHFGHGGQTLDLLEKMGIISQNQPSVDWLIDVFADYPYVLKTALRLAGFALTGGHATRIRSQQARQSDLIELDDDFDLAALKLRFPRSVLSILRRNNRVQSTPPDQLFSVLEYEDIADVLTTELVGSLSPDAAAELLHGRELQTYIVASNLQDDVTHAWLQSRLDGENLLTVMVERVDYAALSIKDLRDRFSGATLCTALRHGGHLGGLRPQDIKELFGGDKEAMTRAVFDGDLFYGGPDWLSSVISDENLAMAVINTQEFARMDPDLFAEYEVYEDDAELFESSLHVQRRPSLVPPPWRVPASRA